MGCQNGQMEVCLKSENYSVHYYLMVHIFKYYVLIYQKLKIKKLYHILLFVFYF